MINNKTPPSSGDIEESVEQAINSPVGNIAAAYELALKQREFEISQFTNRNNFFMIFQGVLLAGIIQSQRDTPQSVNFAIYLAGMVISALQSGVASGAKYWQIRWESAVKELEIQLLEKLRGHNHVTQLFSVDAKHLNQNQLARLLQINCSPQRQQDPLSTRPGYIDDLIDEELQRTGSRHALPYHLIRSRYSVSKAPIWVGLTLFVLWFVLWSTTFTIFGHNLIDWVAMSMQKAVSLDWFAFAFPTTR